MKEILEGGINMRHKQSAAGLLFDIFMTVMTGGGWLIWVFIRYLRTH